MGPRKKIWRKSAVVLRLYSRTNLTFSLEFYFSEDNNLITSLLVSLKMKRTLEVEKRTFNMKWGTDFSSWRQQSNCWNALFAVRSSKLLKGRPTMPSSILGVMNSTPMIDYKGTQGKFVLKIWKRNFSRLFEEDCRCSNIDLAFLLFFNQMGWKYINERRKLLIGLSAYFRKFHYKLIVLITIHMHVFINPIYWRPWWAYGPFKRPSLRKRLRTPAVRTIVA